MHGGLRTGSKPNRWAAHALGESAADHVDGNRFHHDSPGEMTKLYDILGVVVGATLAFASASCGDQGVTCGEGTKAVNGTCVPDGSVVCTGQTRFNPETGACELDASACQDGTVLVNGQCVDAATTTPDATEAAEPNDDVDPTAAGRITVPAVGAKGFVIKGCITPHRDIEQDEQGNPTGDGVMDADRDPWMISVNGPTLLDVRADGVRGLVAGFDLIATDAALPTTAYLRRAVSVVNDQAGREIFLPKAGTYILFVADSRTLLNPSVGPGDANTCYFATITQKALPAPTALTQAQTVASYDGKATIYSITPQEGDVVNAVARPESLKTYGGLVAMKNDAFDSASIETDSAYAQLRAGGLKASDKLALVYDANIVYSGMPVNYLMVANTTHAQALPSDNSAVTLTVPDATLDTLDDFGYTYFDVANANELMFFGLTAETNKKITYTILDSNLAAVATGTTKGLTGQMGAAAQAKLTDNAWFRFAKPGRYYAAFYAPGVTGAYTVKAVRSTATADALTFGSANSIALGDASRNSAFRTLNLAAGKTWIESTASSSNFVGDIRVRAYASDAAGRLDVDARTAFDKTFVKAGSTVVGQILAGNALNQLVRISDAGTPGGAGQTASLTLRDSTITDLATLTAGVTTRTGEAIAGNTTKRYFAKVPTGSIVKVTATPVTPAAFNVAVKSLDAAEGVIATANSAGAGQPETLEIRSLDGWVAFVIDGNGAVAATYNLSINAIIPAAYTEICPDFGGAGMTLAHTPAGGDDGLTGTQTLAFNYNLFGDSVTSFKVSTNGWMSFDSALPLDARAELPDDLFAADAFGFVAPFWADMEQIKLCRLDGTGKSTIEWKGRTKDIETFFGTIPGQPVEVQATLYNDGHLDLSFGGNHRETAEAAIIGVTNMDGDNGERLSREFVGNTGWVISTFVAN